MCRVFSPEEQSVIEEREINFIEDSTIEIDMVAELPDSYVSQPAEKLKLYRELDSIKDESKLTEFESRLVDRFGPLPHPAQGVAECGEATSRSYQIRYGEGEGEEWADDCKLRWRGEYTLF